MIIKHAILYSDRLEFQLDTSIQTFSFSKQYHKFRSDYVFEKSFYNFIKSISHIDMLLLSPEITPFFFNITIPNIPPKEFLSLIRTNYLKPLHLEKAYEANFIHLKNKNKKISFELLIYNQELIEYILRLFSNYSILVNNIVPLIVNIRSQLPPIQKDLHNFHFFEESHVGLIVNHHTSNYVLFSLPASWSKSAKSNYSSTVNRLFSIVQTKSGPYMKQSGPSFGELIQSADKEIEKFNIYRFFKKNIVRHTRVFSRSILILILLTIINIFMIIKNDSLISNLKTKSEQKYKQFSSLSSNVARYNQFRHLKKKAFLMLTENQIISQFIGNLPAMLPSPIKIVKLEYQYKYVTRFERFKKTIRIHGNSVRDHSNWERHVSLAIENMQQFLPEARIYLASGFYSDNSNKGLFTIDIELETRKFEFE